MDPADAFLAVYLPYVVGTHFMRLEILETAQKSAAGPAADLIHAELAALPIHGPQVVSAVVQVEQILKAAGHEPPPPPHTPAEHAAWQSAILQALRPPPEATAALDAARGLGDAEQTLRLQLLVDRLRAAHPDNAWLRSQRDDLEKARTASLLSLRELVPAPLGEFPGDAIARAIRTVEAARDPARRAEAAPILTRQAAIVEQCMNLPRPRVVLADVRAGKLGWRAALRPLLQTPGWSFLTGGGGVTRVFTDADAVRGSGTRGACITTTAWAALQRADVEADELVIDPGLPHETRIPKSDLVALRRLAASAGIESIVRDWSGVHMAALRAYEGYRVLYDDTRLFHVWAPGAGTTPYAVVLPSEDALAAYVAKTPAPAGAKIGSFPGAKLFSMLATLNPAGIVFDPLGPMRPRWFGRPFLDQLAELA